MTGAAMGAAPHPIRFGVFTGVAQTTWPDLLGVWRRADEWYAFRSNPRGRVHVLATLDERSYDPGDAAMGADHPIAWCRRYGGGHSVYTAMGHMSEFYREPAAIFWVYGFPLILAVALGIAFRERPIEKPTVDIVVNDQDVPRVWISTRATTRSPRRASSNRASPSKHWRSCSRTL